MNPKNIIVEQRFRKSLGDISSLADSIRKVGLLHPIVISRDRHLVSGERRLEAWKKLYGNKPIPVNVIAAYLREAEVHENTVRQDFTASEMVAVKRYFQPEIEKNNPVGRPIDNCGKLPQFHGEKTRDLIGKLVGVSGKTLEKAEYIVDQAESTPEKFKPILDDVDKGKKSIDRGFKDIQRIRKQEKQRKGVELPQGTYDVILADPPWRYQNNSSNRGKAEMHYPTMTLQDIKELPIHSNIAENSALFLWATNPCLLWAIEVLEAWGFTYKTNYVWLKDKIGTGFYNRGQHELLLIGVRGSIGAPADGDRLPSVIKAPRTVHSEKPEQVYGIIEKMYPNRKYLELFARKKRENWASWGDEV